jgi:hypothetical protein
MTIAEQIYALVKTLPQDQADEILTFAEFSQDLHKVTSFFQLSVRNFDLSRIPNHFHYIFYHFLGKFDINLQ